MPEKEILTREIRFEPAYDKRNSDPHKNYGVHCVTMRWLLKGKHGAIQFVVFTGWHLPHVAEELKQCNGGALLLAPMAADIGYHSYVPEYEGQTSMGACEFLNGAECYYDGSGLSAEPILNKLISEGHEAVWAEMEERYYACLCSSQV